MQPLEQHTFSFNIYTLDLTRGCLFRGDETVKLRPKSFETLRHLVVNSGRLVSKTELNIARIYALGGKSEEAVKWLRITVTEGFSHYPLFARDTFLDPIRETTAFKQFMAEMKSRWEGYQRQFG